MATPLISVRDLTRTYSLGEVVVRALRGVSLDVDPPGPQHPAERLLKQERIR